MKQKEWIVTRREPGGVDRVFCSKCKKWHSKEDELWEKHMKYL